MAFATTDDAPREGGSAFGDDLIETKSERGEAGAQGGDERGVGRGDEDGVAECAVANEGAEDVGIDG